MEVVKVFLEFMGVLVKFKGGGVSLDKIINVDGVFIVFVKSKVEVLNLFSFYLRVNKVVFNIK